MYRIVQWNARHENNRSRELKDARWVAVPNGMDGDGYIGMVDGTVEGCLSYAGWVAMLLISSRCAPRGDLRQTHGAPHTDKTIAAKSRMPLKVIRMAIAKAKEIGWLMDVSDSVAAPDCGIGAVIPQETEIPSSEMEWKRREENSEVRRPREASEPAVEQVPVRVIERAATIDVDPLWIRLEAARPGKWLGNDRMAYCRALDRYGQMAWVEIDGVMVSPIALFERVGLAVIASPGFTLRSMGSFLDYAAKWYSSCEIEACWPERTEMARKAAGTFTKPDLVAAESNRAMEAGIARALAKHNGVKP